MAGEGGGRVLSEGRSGLKAGQVVGVVVADGCSLEILPKIDFPTQDGEPAIAPIRKRLVHMLAVALDLKIATGAVTELGWQRESLLEILIGLFAAKLSDAVRQGMPRRYIACEDDLPVLRGRLNMTRQFTALLATPQTLACRYDVLSPDVALNQIMKAAVGLLAKVSRSSANQRRLRELTFTYADISDVPRQILPWNEVVLDRTNAQWRELVSLARLLLGERFQTTSAGSDGGFSLLFEMNTLFEAFIARSMKLALAGTPLSVHVQGGRLYCLEETPSGSNRFMTKPDILIKRGGAVELIIDTKWKRLSSRIDDPKKGVSQADVYQMMAYGQVYRCNRLMLLYPHHAELTCSEGALNRHRVRNASSYLTTATIDVSSSQGFSQRLTALATDPSAQPSLGCCSAAD
ncbi:McrC family protein [Caulobacter sp. KR2-114]|uniref:McrC family protein n=1 Tax=Caulobacter sp. KR2-114 TaxID=3400912 RepID=UPI003C0800C7